MELLFRWPGRKNGDVKQSLQSRVRQRCIGRAMCCPKYLQPGSIFWGVLHACARALACAAFLVGYASWSQGMAEKSKGKSRLARKEWVNSQTYSAKIGEFSKYWGVIGNATRDWRVTNQAAGLDDQCSRSVEE